jgi:hypothetical protein
MSSRNATRKTHVTAAVRTLPVKYNTQVVYMRMNLRTVF